jgi:hypothetical protein
VALPDNEYVTSDIRSVDNAVLAVSMSEIIQYTDFKALSKIRFFATPSGGMCLLVSFTLLALHLGYIYCINHNMKARNNG